MTEGDGEVVTLEHLDFLAISPAFALGTRAVVPSSHEEFYCAGYTSPKIADLLGWTQSNVWVPDHALSRMKRRHSAFVDHLRAIEMIIQNPDSIRYDPSEPAYTRFVTEASMLRNASLLTSRSMSYVDVLVELRLAVHEFYLRVFHLSPTRQPLRGRQRWP